MERTFSIIKPDATKRNISGRINQIIEENGFRIIAQKRIKLTTQQAIQFYSIHNKKPFFNDLINYMTSGPVVVQVLEANNAVDKYREIMGATNPAEAVEGSIRRDYAESLGENTVHGSDSLENAAIEIAYFFSQTEIVNSTS